MKDYPFDTPLQCQGYSEEKNEVVKCHYPGSHQGPLGLQYINIPAQLFMPAPKTLAVKLLGKNLRLNHELKSGYNYNVPLKCWHFPQLGVVAHSCDSATGELGLWIVVGWDPPDEAGHVEPVSALSLLSTWPPPGSRRWPGSLMSQEPGQVGHRATQTGHMRQ